MHRLPPIPPALTDWLRELFAGRRCILAIGATTAGLRWGRILRELGAEPPLILADEPGAGPPPGAGEATVVERPPAAREARPADLLERLRDYERWLAAPPPEVVAAIERYDPGGEAVLITSHVSDVQAIAGRPRYAARRPAWGTLEDKVVVDALWDDAGIARAPSRIVPADRDALMETARQLDFGVGTAWVADARDGFHGGATRLRWVRDRDQAEEAFRFLAARADRVRVMPFLEGTPCSIHGIVLPDAVIALRPLEMITLRRPGRSELFYAGAATWWDPHPADRRAMQRIARRVGAVLRHGHRYRGAFTIDGVLTADGFLPTELNARAGAGMRLLSASRPELLLELLLLPIVEDEPLPVPGAVLERLVVTAADARRQGGGWCELSAEVGQPAEMPVRFDAVGRCRPAGDADPPDGRLAVRPAPMGGALRFDPDPARTPTGPPLAGRVAAAFALADRVFEAGLGRLAAAPAVR
ncbi:MAG: ATP-grasp domain-containing protein [Planctomycetota bacterium]